VSKDPRESVVTILKQTSTGFEVVGVGFMVGKRHVATCAHVVNSALAGRAIHDDGKPGPDETVVVEFSLLGDPPHDSRNARVVGWRPPPPAANLWAGRRDIAILEIVNQAPPRGVPFAKLGKPLPGSAIDVYGIPPDPPERPGAWSGGTVRGEIAGGFIQVDDRLNTAIKMQPGYSGSPLLDIRSGKVVGMLVIASILEDLRDCYAIPPEWLREIMSPEVRVRQQLVARAGWIRSRARRAAVVLARRLRAAWAGVREHPFRFGTVAVVGVLLLEIIRPGSLLPGRSDAGDAFCIPVEVAVSTEKDELVADMAREYNESDRTFDGGRCATVSVHGLSSGSTMRALAADWKADHLTGPLPPRRPQVWLPTSSMWLGLLQERGKGNLLPKDAPSVTSSVLGIAMPRRMANALRSRYQGNVGWRQILNLAIDPKGWGSLGHQEWGQFALGRDKPHVSTSGLAATVATYYAATGKSQPVRGIESSVANYGDEATQFMQKLYIEDSKRRNVPNSVPFVSAVVVQEQLAHLYNRGSPLGNIADPENGGKPPNERMEMIYPVDGTLKLDHPYVVLRGTNNEVDKNVEGAARNFREFLEEDAQQDRFIELGFRTREAPERPTDILKNSVGAPADQRLSLLGLPQSNLIERMQAGWDANRKKAQVLVALDVSGSMGDPVDPDNEEGVEKIDLLKPAALRGFRLLDDLDEAELWTFSSNPDYRRRVPMSRVQDAGPTFERVINDISPKGNTALYKTTMDAHAYMLDRLDSERINAIILLTDGKNFPRDDKGRAELLRRIDAKNLETSIRIFTISYGSDADVDLLEQIAERSKASYYNATDPRDIDKVLVSAFSNFG
jgi:Ca-activated chloride channel family protein